MPRLLLLSGVLCIGGCAIPQPNVNPAQLANVQNSPKEVNISVSGDWNDLNAALVIGLGKLNLAVVDARMPTDARFEYDLVDVMDRPAVLTIERQAASDPGPILITARFTRFRDVHRETLLVAAIAQRFDELRGVDVAPIR